MSASDKLADGSPEGKRLYDAARYQRVSRVRIATGHCAKCGIRPIRSGSRRYCAECLVYFAAWQRGYDRRMAGQ